MVFSSDNARSNTMSETASFLSLRHERSKIYELCIPSLRLSVSFVVNPLAHMDSYFRFRLRRDSAKLILSKPFIPMLK